MNCNILIEGSGFLNHLNPIIRFLKVSSLFAGNIDHQDFIGVVKNDSIIEVFVKEVPNDYSFTSIQLSLNGGYNFKELQRISLTSK